MSDAIAYEECCVCDEPAGHAGRGEDSLYCDHCGAGPFCEECFDHHGCLVPAPANLVRASCESTATGECPGVAPTMSEVEAQDKCSVCHEPRKD